MWRYSDFLAVREDFIPVFSEEVDKNHREDWKFFIPHDQMKTLLDKLMIALERAHGGDKRSIWLTGAYGTGKTYASFVIKHLLEDDLEVIEEYFKKHQILTPLWQRFKALRQKKPYLVIYRSASGHITSSRGLMIEIQQAIKEQLRAHGYSNAFSESLMDQLVSKLSDPSGIFNWEAAFVKYRGRFRTVATAAGVIERLRAGDVKLGEQVAAVLEEEGLTLADSPAAVKAWIKEVIEANELQGIIFIWDEFTEFFTNNVPVTPLQELAQATADMPFYLILITHRSLNQFTRVDEETRKKLLDRFHNCQLEMVPITAYKLISNVIEIKPDYKREWEDKLDSLWDQVEKAVLQIHVLGEQINKEEIKRMIPIHPYTAYLLATISSLYSSSQRTLFQFLKTDPPGSFQWFIANYPQNSWYWLTPDYLWQYFFEDVRDVNIGNVEAIGNLLGYYNSKKSDMNEEELRVFRLMLLLLALWNQTQGVHSLLKPKLSNIKNMFLGTELYQKVKEIADELCSRNIMYAVSIGNDLEYIIPTSTIDQNKLNECFRWVENAFNFEKVAKEKDSDVGFASKIVGLLSLSGATKLRHPIQIFSAKEFKSRRERLLQGVDKPYEIGVIFLVAQEEGDLAGSEVVAAEVSKACPHYCILISQVAFGARDWKDWLDSRSHCRYYQEAKEDKMQRYYDIKSKDIVDKWLNMVRIGRIRAFFKGQQEELDGCQAVTGYLEDIVNSVFPYGPEKLSKVATLYAQSWGKAGAEIGLGIAHNIQQPYKNVVNELQLLGFWEGKVSVHSDHPLSKMQRVVDEFFNTNDHVNLKQLWEALQQPPYGLMPSPIGILIFAFLLRKYANGYYYSDGNNSFPLNPNKLAELIEQVMKGFKFSENYTIRKMSIDGECFCHIARNVFYLTQEQASYPEEARKNIRKIVSELGFPLWTLIYYIKRASSIGSANHIIEAVKKLNEILTFTKDELEDRDIKGLVDVVNPVCHDLSKMINRERMQEGMRSFWEIYNPQLISLMEKLRLEVSHVMNKLRILLNEDAFLWTEESVKEKLPEVVTELDLVDALNCLLGVKRQDLNELRNYFRNNWFKGKLPLIWYKEGQPDEIGTLIEYLYELIYRPSQGIKVNRSEDIRRYSSQLASVLNKGPFVVGVLVQKYTGHTLSDAESEALYNELSDLSQASEDEARSAIVRTLNNQVRQKKIAQLRQRWQELTGSESPERWSEERGVPIQWMLEGKDHHVFFECYDNIHKLAETDIDKLIEHLSHRAAEFVNLQDQQYVSDRFIRVIAGDYAELVLEANMADQLQAYIRKTLDGNIYRWPMLLSEIHQLVRKWVTENYRSTAYPKILKVIETIPPEEIKQLIIQLAADDALVGTKVLASISKVETKPRKMKWGFLR